MHPGVVSISQVSDDWQEGDEIDSNDRGGSDIPPASSPAVGNNCYKICLTIESNSKGKTGGARVITTVLVTRETVYLLDIYDRSERTTISDAK